MAVYGTNLTLDIVDSEVIGDSDCHYKVVFTSLFSISLHLVIQFILFYNIFSFAGCDINLDNNFITINCF